MSLKAREVPEGVTEGLISLVVRLWQRHVSCSGHRLVSVNGQRRVSVSSQRFLYRLVGDELRLIARSESLG
jgi:hypothetical protein